MKTITLDWLDDQCACCASMQVFSDLFGTSCKLTQASVRRWLDEGPYGAVYDLGWLVLHLMVKRHRPDGRLRSLPLARKVLNHLGVEKSHWDTNALRAMDEVKKLPRRRLIRAIVQIAEQSPNI